MLAYLDALIDALAVRDTAAVDRLLAHPLARILPEGARDEARRLSAADADPLAAPLRVMQLRHMTAELLRDAPEAPVIADVPLPAEQAAGAEPVRAPGLQSSTTRRQGRLVQMELPLSA